MKILVADDSITTLKRIKASLQALGHEVLSANNGQEAIEWFQASRPDLVILDVVMEGMNGFDCAKKIRAMNKEDWIPIIFLSGSADDDSIAKGIDAGGDDYLTKPYSELKLAAKIKAMQRIASMRQELYEATKQLAYLSSIDSLTGSYNRLQFNKSIQEKIAESSRQNSRFALLFLDLDKFKSINDSLGHPVGDQLLIKVSERLRSCLRLNDFLARMGGDEFALILSQVEDEKNVALVAQKIIDALSAPYKIEKHLVKTSSSIGIAMYPSDGSDLLSLTKNADVAMYHAKNSGRNQYQFFKNIPHSNHKQNASEELESKINVLNCLIQDTAICIDLQYIKKTIFLPQLERMPKGPSYLVGLMNLAGQSIPIIDLEARLNKSRSQAYSLNTPILLCGDKKKQLGFIVDKILGLSRIDVQKQTNESKQDSSLFLASPVIDSKISLWLNVPYLLKEVFL